MTGSGGLARRDIVTRALGAGVALGLGALHPGAARGAAHDGAAARRHWPRVAALLDRYVDGGKVAGMVAAIGAAHGDPEVLARGHPALGAARGESVDSLFRIYSMTKPITGMAAMILIDAGRLRLDQPLADILPRFAEMQVQVTPDGSLADLRPARTAITIRHLLTHTAGLGYTIVQKGPIRRAYEAEGIVPGRISRLHLPGLESPPPAASLAEFADHLAGLPLVYEPGTRWSYSVALDLLGRVIEVVAGQPFEAFLHEHIFAPVGMRSTFFQVPAAAAARLTTNYAVWKGHLLPIDGAADSLFREKPPFPFGGAGLVSSPRDYDRFLKMVLNLGMSDGWRVMSGAAVRLGASNLLPPGAVTAGTMIAGAGFGAGGRVGLGADEGTFGWGGAAGTVGYCNFRYGMRASLFTQYMPSDAYPLHREFPQLVEADLAARAAAWAPAQ